MPPSSRSRGRGSGSGRVAVRITPSASAVLSSSIFVSWISLYTEHVQHRGNRRNVIKIDGMTGPPRAEHHPPFSQRASPRGEGGHRARPCFEDIIDMVWAELASGPRTGKPHGRPKGEHPPAGHTPDRGKPGSRPMSGQAARNTIPRTTMPAVTSAGRRRPTVKAITTVMVTAVMAIAVPSR